MSRDAENRAKQANDYAISTAKQYGQTAAGLAGQLTPIYSTMATNPTGMSSAELNAAKTGAMQAAGGGVASAVGQGNLEAARTGNAGGYQAALRDAARKGIATNANNSLKIQNLNTALKEEQRRMGLSGMQGLQSQDQASQLGFLGQGINAVDAQSNAGRSGWFQNMVGLINAMSNAGKAAASLGVGGGGGGQ